MSKNLISNLIIYVGCFYYNERHLIVKSFKYILSFKSRTLHVTILSLQLLKYKISIIFNYIFIYRLINLQSILKTDFFIDCICNDKPGEGIFPLRDNNCRVTIKVDDDK
jgi:hypothetical protein